MLIIVHIHIISDYHHENCDAFVQSRLPYLHLIFSARWKKRLWRRFPRTRRAGRFQGEQCSAFQWNYLWTKCFREVCAPSNCEFRPAEKVISPQPRTNHFQIILNCNDCFQVCRDDEQELIQNIPTEDCSLEPQEDCRMETVLVPRLLLTFKKSWSWSSWLIFWYILTFV